MKHINYAVLMLAICVVSQTQLYAQTWRWGARGGSASFEASAWESVIDMDTDPNGNVYVLSNAYKSGINVTGGGASVTGVGRENVLITSYRCDGSFRWKKLIGGPNDNNALSLQVDSSGGVYATFFMPLHAGIMPVNGYVDSDTTIIGKINRTLYLVKYDTAGNYKWLKYPQPDTMSLNTAYSYTRSIDINVDGAGNIYWLCYLTPASYDNGAFIIANDGLYLIKYNTHGVFQSIVTMDMEIDRSTIFNSIKMQQDYRSGRFYISGTYFNGPFTMGGTTIDKSMFVGAFSSSGALIWKRLSAVGGGFFYRPIIDDSAHVYLGGALAAPDTFNSYIAPLSSRGPFITKMDSNGNHLWAASTIPQAATFAAGGLALRNHNEIILSGASPGWVTWHGYSDTLKHNFPGGVYLSFISRFNSHTGQLIAMEQLPSTVGTRPYATMSDGRNNIYIGGELMGQMNINGNTYLKTGGNADFYIAKYGHDNCNCSSGPNSSLFSKTYLDDSTVQFTATGFANDDTLYWNYGDNVDTSLLTSPVHRFSDTGTFNVCLTITNGCGDSTSCDTVRITNPCVLAAFKPQADFSFSIDSAYQRISVSYSGSQPHDSVVYDFGDGSKVNASNHTHTYANAGRYIVCATTYNSCGSHTKCDTVEIPVTIQNITAKGAVLIYPNPANDVLHIDGLEPGSRIELYDITGRKAHEIIAAKAQETVNMSYLAPSSYIIQLTGTDGTRVTEKVLKR